MLPTITTPTDPAGALCARFDVAIIPVRNLFGLWIPRQPHQFQLHEPDECLGMHREVADWQAM